MGLFIEYLGDMSEANFSLKIKFKSRQIMNNCIIYSYTVNTVSKIIS